MVGLQIIQRWELKPEAEQRELVLSCDPRRSFREPGTKQRFRARRLISFRCIVHSSGVSAS